MSRSTQFRALLAIGVAGMALSGCLSPRALVREGNADTVEIEYGGDVANAMPLARRHCAQFERVPQLVQADGEFAVFDCRRQ